MTTPLQRPNRKDPTKRTRLPLLPQGARSRQAQLLTRTAAEGRFELPTCSDCGLAHYPPRDACPKCLSGSIAMATASPRGTVLAETTVRVSPDVFFRERMPWRIGTVLLEAGLPVIAHLHGDVTTGQPVRLAWHLDRSGQAVAFAWPEQETPHMAEDAQAREMTLDPKFRRVLVTDARSAVGQACIRAFAEAGSAIIFAGLAEPWKPCPGLDALRKTPGLEIVTLDVTNGDSITELAAEIGARVDIVVNTAEHVRPGGILDRTGITVAREELEVRLPRPRAAGAGVRASDAVSWRRWRNCGLCVGQCAVDLRARELAGLWRILGGAGRAIVGIARPSRGTAAGRCARRQCLYRATRHGMVPDRAAAEGDPAAGGEGHRRCAQARPRRRLCRRRRGGSACAPCRQSQSGRT